MRGLALSLGARAGALPPLLLATLGILFLTLMDAVIKAQMQAHAVTFSVFVRFVYGALFAAIVVLIVRPPRPTRAEVRANLVRAPVVVVTASSFFLSVSLLPLAEAISLSFMAPGFIAILGVLWLKERLTGAIMIALGAGFAGMVVMLWPQLSAGVLSLGSGSTLGVVAALFSALAYAFNVILLRKLAVNQHPATIVFFQNAGPALLLIPLALWFWSALTPADHAMFALGGALGVSGHLMLTAAFARAPASRLAPTEYSSLIWAAMIGVIWFAEVPTPYTFAGAALIVAGSLWLGRR
jgi:S-adenosylmethionine uptake transporter